MFYYVSVMILFGCVCLVIVIGNVLYDLFGCIWLQLMLFGLFGDDYVLLYSVSVNYLIGLSLVIDGSVNVMYCMCMVEINVSVGVGMDFQQGLFGVCGVLVVYCGGIMLL